MANRAWAHLHLPRLRSGNTPDVISLKVPGEKIRYVSAIELENVELKVSEAGRQRCIREGVRNVHAWVVGEIVRQDCGPGVAYLIDTRRFRKVVYDPWKGGAFVDAETLEPVLTASAAVMIYKEVWVK